MSLSNIPTDNAIKILLALSQYPILGKRVRHIMRKNLFTRGVITREVFDLEVRQKAVESQMREGLNNPYEEEQMVVWEERLHRVREALTDSYFANNFPYFEFENIVRKLLSELGGEESEFVWFNPELAPQDMLFEQAEMIEAMHEDERKKYEARLQELKAVLIRTMISDQLKYIKIARQWFTVDDLKNIRARKIGGGKIGGKAAGMLLAMRIIKETAPQEIRNRFRLPESYYLGSDVFYNFLTFNNLVHWNDQKYKTEDQMRTDFPKLREEFSCGQFPSEIIDSLDRVLTEVGTHPLIVRSSSLLEDNFGTSFAGKYESIFLPNQASHDERLETLSRAIATIYASVLHPDALMYRHQKELADYDERIGILIQIVEGEKFGRYYFPHAAGVAFSRNLYRWSPQIKQNEGFLRLVWGLGTRAVDMVADDHPRLVALSHPHLHSSSDIRNIKRYSQQKIDVIDLDTNDFTTVPVHNILHPDYEPLRYIVQIEYEGGLIPIRSRLASTEKMIITFDGLLSRTPFSHTIRSMLRTLETHYGSPVDVEFTVELDNFEKTPDVIITLLQCRPQSHIEGSSNIQIPNDLQESDIVFSSHTMVPQGVVEKIRYVLFVPSEEYFKLVSQNERFQLERTISHLNSALKNEIFIAVGPGRWGTSTPDLGVHVAYSDIYNARALVELAGDEIGASPEPSFGTHFFQDLMEADIYPLAVFLDDDNTLFDRGFFYDTPNRLNDFVAVENPRVVAALKLIAVDDHRRNAHMDLIMDANKSRAVAFLVEETQSIEEDDTVLGAAPSGLE